MVMSSTMYTILWYINVQFSSHHILIHSQLMLHITIYLSESPITVSSIQSFFRSFIHLSPSTRPFVHAVLVYFRHYCTISSKDEILADADTKTIAFLVVGDPLGCVSITISLSSLDVISIILEPQHIQIWLFVQLRKIFSIKLYIMHPLSMLLVAVDYK